MLAYSSISHAGYMLLAILSMNEHSAGSVLYYAAAYSVSTIGAFAILSILEKDGEAITFDSFAGLGKRNPLLAFAMTIAMLSLSGIPPLAGFFGKYYIFTSALQSGFLWLVLIAVLGSLIGVYYYFRVIIKMYSPSPTLPEGKGEDVQLLPFWEVGWGLKFVLVATILLSLLLGIFPDAVIRLL